MGYLLPILSFDMPLGLINPLSVILNQKPEKRWLLMQRGGTQAYVSVS